MAPGKERLSFPGPGGYTITWSPGTRHFPLEPAPSGHLIMPCGEYTKVRKPPGLPRPTTTFHATRVTEDPEMSTEPTGGAPGVRVTSSSRPSDVCTPGGSETGVPIGAAGVRVTSFSRPSEACTLGTPEGEYGVAESGGAAGVRETSFSRPSEARTPEEAKAAGAAKRKYQ